MSVDLDTPIVEPDIEESAENSKNSRERFEEIKNSTFQFPLLWSPHNFTI